MMPLTPPPLTSADQLITAMQDLPLQVHMAAALGVLIGIVLWLAGRSVIKPIFALVGFGVGGAMGYALVPLTGVIEIFSIPSPYIGLGAGGLFGLVLAVTLFRIVIATSSACVLGALAALSTVAYLQVAPLESPDSTSPASGEPIAMMPALELSEQFLPGVVRTSSLLLPAAQTQPAPEEAPPEKPENTPESPSESDPPTDQELPSQFQPGDPDQNVDKPGDKPKPDAGPGVTQRVQAFGKALGDEIQNAWDRQPPIHRLTIGGATLAGLALGLLMGIIMPERASAGVTALAGSGIMLPNTIWLSYRYNMPWNKYLEQDVLVWLIIWLSLASLGLIIQIVTISKPKKKPSENSEE